MRAKSRLPVNFFATIWKSDVFQDVVQDWYLADDDLIGPYLMSCLDSLQEEGKLCPNCADALKDRHRQLQARPNLWSATLARVGCTPFFRAIPCLSVSRICCNRVLVCLK